MRFHAAAVGFLLAWSPLAAQSTWIVDDSGGPGVHFTSLPAAVAAAASGDTLLVAPGHYDPFWVSGKALTIVGDGPTTTIIDGAFVTFPGDYVRIADPPAGQVFRLAGVRLKTGMPSFGFGIAHNARLALLDSGTGPHGSVVVHDVITEVVPGLIPGGLGMRIVGLTAQVQRCEFVAGQGVSTGSASAIGYPGARVSAGAVLVADSCSFRGGDATMLDEQGGTGLEVTSATVWLTRSTCVGGAAPASGGQCFGGCGLAGQIGAFIHANGSSQLALIGGPAGPAPIAVPGAGLLLGSATAWLHGQVFTATTTPTGLISPSIGGNGTIVAGPVRPQLALAGTAASGASLAAAQPVTLSIDQGAAGQLFALLLDTTPAVSLLAPLTAEPLLLANPIVPIVGLLDPTGAYAITFLPALHTPQLVGLPLHLQAFAFDSTAGSWNGSNAVIQRFSL